MRGVSGIIATVLILMIAVVMAGLTFVFFSDTFSQTSTSTSSVADTYTNAITKDMVIENMAANTLYIRNAGSQDLSGFTVLLNEDIARFNVTPTVLKPGETGTITIYDYVKKGDKVRVYTKNGYVLAYADPCKSAAVCLHFDEGLGSVAYDSSRNANNGSLGTNILPNPGFESGLWISGSQWYLDTGYGGLKGARLNNSGSYCNDYQYVDLAVTQNKSYTIGAWIKTNETNMSFRATVGIAVPPSWTYFKLSSTQLVGENNWTWVSMPNYYSGTNASLRFFVTEQHCSPPNTNKAWFDDVYAGYDMPSWTGGKYGNSLNFDGIDDTVTVLNSPSVNISGSELTVEAWIYPRTPTAGYTHFIRKETPGFGFWLMPTGTLYGEIYHPGWNTGEGYTSVAGSTVLQANRWYHVAMSYKQNSYFRIFIDGKLDGSNIALNKQIGTSASNLIIGYPGWMGSNNVYFNGLIDEVRIYNRAIYY